jgi:hypothetical protein
MVNVSEIPKGYLWWLKKYVFFGEITAAVKGEKFVYVVNIQYLFWKGL